MTEEITEEKLLLDEVFNEQISESKVMSDSKLTDSETKTPTAGKSSIVSLKNLNENFSSLGPGSEDSTGKSTGNPETHSPRKHHSPKKPKSPKLINQREILKTLKPEISPDGKRTILKKPFEEQTYFRKDRNGTKIVHGGKKHQICFKKKLVEVHLIETFKFYNGPFDDTRAPCTCNIF